MLQPGRHESRDVVSHLRALAQLTSPAEGAEVFLMAHSLPMVSAITDAAGKFEFPPMATLFQDSKRNHLGTLLPPGSYSSIGIGGCSRVHWSRRLWCGPSLPIMRIRGE